MVVPLDDIQVDDHLIYVERPVVILDKKTKALRNKEVSLVKVQWQIGGLPNGSWSPMRRYESTTMIYLWQQNSRKKSSSSGGEL